MLELNLVYVELGKNERETHTEDKRVQKLTGVLNH